jgi:hypothetical protein
VKPKEIIVPILNDEYKVIVAVGNAKWCRQVAKKHGYKTGPMSLNDGSARGWTFYQVNRHPLIWLLKPPITAEYIGTLAHEAIHAIDYIWMVTNDVRTTEAFTHSVGAIVRMVMKEYL